MLQTLAYNPHAGDVLIKLDGGFTPSYATDFAAGADLAAKEDYFLPRGEIVKVKFGFSTAMPSYLVGLLRPRSGIASKHGIVMASSGVIDSDYRGEWMIPLINLGPEDYQIKTGDRVAQVVFVKYDQPKFLEQESLPTSSRDVGGFGSTGV